MLPKSSKVQPMTKRVPALIARTRFGQILDRVAHSRERFVVTKKGEAAAVILGMDDYLRSVAKTPPAETKDLQARLKKGAQVNAALDRQITEEWDAIDQETWEPASS